MYVLYYYYSSFWHVDKLMFTLILQSLDNGTQIDKTIKNIGLLSFNKR